MTNAAASGLQAVWEAHGRPDPEPRQGLSRRRIVAAAMELADAEGLAAVSMARVAARVGFTTMSLYRHVRNKDELLLFMQDAALGPPPPRDPDPTDWRSELEWWAGEVVAAFRAHPWVLQTIALFGPPATPNQLTWLELGLRALGGTALTEPEKVATMLLIDAHVIGDIQFGGAGPEHSVDELTDYGALLARMLDPARFPAVLRAVHGGAFEPGDDPAADRDETFRFGLARILDGVQALLDSRR
ncbi:MAG TPA: TetR/AcrR family transcriptional regulator [Pseudonocardiaceae bacterium]